MVSPEQYPLNIDRVLKLERDNMLLRAMIANRDSEIMALDAEIRDLKKELEETMSTLDLWQSGKA